MKSPIFLFSLPRSGSTLLQKVLMSNSDISSISEPWLMLPLSYMHKNKGLLTEYSHTVSYFALKDFIANLPNKEDDYYGAMHTFVNTLYEKQCLHNEKYFLDKTPRYYNIIPEIYKVFPDAKFIFLFRNPLHVMSSIVQTWCGGTFKNLYEYDRDLHYGPEALSRGYKLLKDKSYAIQYEEFVLNPEKCIQEVCDYLEIDFDKGMISNFSVQDTKGKMGDPTGIKEYKNIKASSLDKWKEVFNTPFRKKVIYKYIHSIDAEALAIQGYNKELILKEIKNLNIVFKLSVVDIAHYLYSITIRYSKANIFFGKFTKKWARRLFLS
jgi:hypothetical protein